jgi:hypothetical protein
MGAGYRQEELEGLAVRHTFEAGQAELEESADEMIETVDGHKCSEEIHLYSFGT